MQGICSKQDNFWYVRIVKSLKITKKRRERLFLLLLLLLLLFQLSAYTYSIRMSAV